MVKEELYTVSAEIEYASGLCYGGSLDVNEAVIEQGLIPPWLTKRKKAVKNC